jgi:hypothetical protein
MLVEQVVPTAVTADVGRREPHLGVYVRRQRAAVIG